MAARLEPLRSGKAQTSSPFQIPTYRNFWFGGMVSNLGAHVHSVGASWMMVSIGGTTAQVALVQASTALPFVFLSLAAGAMADNLDRRRLMLGAQCFMLAVSVFLAAVAWLGQVTPWILLTLTFLIGCGTAFNAPASQSSVADMVPRSAISSAVALKSMSFNVARCIGPSIGGAIVVFAGVAVTFAANALSYLGLIVVLLQWRPAPLVRRVPRETVSGAMAAGIRYVAMSPTIRVVLLRGTIFGSTASAVPALMPLVSRDLLSGEALTYGALLGAFGMGAVAAALSNGALRRRFSAEAFTRLAGCAWAMGALITGLSRSTPLTLMGLALTGAGWMVALAAFNVTVQMASPRWVAGRSLALYQTFLLGGMAAGSAAFGFIGEHWGVQNALIVAAALQVCCVLTGFKLALPPVDDLDLDPLDGWVEPNVEVGPRSGPVLISVEYRIRDANTATFLKAINERRRIHRRDGARGWTLARDLLDNELWVESYCFPTWLDYVRHNHRRTRDDAPSWNWVHSVHEGPERPRVRRCINASSLATTRRDRTAASPYSAQTDPTNSG